MTYWDSLPQKRMGAGCLIFDEHGRVLLVKPNYKPGWEIPGGVVEKSENMTNSLKNRVLAAGKQLSKNGAIYTENQE